MGVYRMKDTECRELIAENLALYRKNSGMTQSELAQKIQYSDKTNSTVSAKCRTMRSANQAQSG